MLTELINSPINHWTLFDARLLNVDFLAIARVHGLVDHNKLVRSRAARQGNKTKKLKQLKK